MIKQQGANGNKQFWSFKDNGKRFTVSKRNLLFTFKVHDEVTCEWFQSQQVELYKINERTIEAAFDPKISSVSHQFLQPSQKDAILRFVIKLQYVTTQFSEDIDLKKLQISKQNAMKFQFEELKQEIAQVSHMIEHQRKMNAENEIIIEKNEYNNSGGLPIYELEAKEGKHVLTITGCYLSQKVYEGDYGDECGDEYQDQQYPYMQHLNFPLKTQIYIGKELIHEVISPKPSFGEGYDVPFVVTEVLDVKQQGKIKIICSLENGENVIINQFMLTMFPVNQYN